MLRINAVSMRKVRRIFDGGVYSRNYGTYKNKTCEAYIVIELSSADVKTFHLCPILHEISWKLTNMTWVYIYCIDYLLTLTLSSNILDYQFFILSTQTFLSQLVVQRIISLEKPKKPLATQARYFKWFCET